MRKFIFGTCFFFFLCSLAQDSVRVLTLDECINMALSRNLTIKQNQNNLIAAQSNKKQAYYNFLPDLNAQARFSITEGTIFDNSSGRFVTTTTRRFGPSPEISSSLVLFNAFANHHLLNRRTQEYNSSFYQLEDSKIALKADVIRSYLNVLVDLENLRISNERLEFLDSQLDREKKRVSVGVGDLGNVYNFQSQVATEKLTNVNLSNQYQSDLLNLTQLLQLNSDIEVQVESISTLELDDLVMIEDFEVIFEEIFQNSFRLKSASSSKEAAKFQLSQAKSSRYPFIGLDAGYGTQYSSNNSGDLANQLENLNYKYIGASVQIPIFNRYRTQNNIDNAEVGYMNAQIGEDQAILDVTNAAQSDYLDLVAAQTSYLTAEENYEALSQTFEFIKKRFETGNTDFYSYLESLNNKNMAEAQLINAKYTIVLRKRIIDLYRGK